MPIINSGGNAIVIDQSIVENSTNPVAGGAVYTALAGKQATLVSGSNIKTINGTTVLGSGNIAVQPTLVGSGTGQNIKTVNNTNVMGEGNIAVQPLLGSTYQNKTFGSDTKVAQITVDATGAITGIADVNITDVVGDTWKSYSVNIDSTTTGLSWTVGASTTDTMIIVAEVLGQPGVYLSAQTTNGCTVNGATASGTLILLVNADLGTVTATTA